MILRDPFFITTPGVTIRSGITANPGHRRSATCNSLKSIVR
jgi:hypothetical protein